MIYICGDTHGKEDIHKLTSKKFSEGKSLTKDDFVIVIGDFGVLWNISKYWLDQEKYLINWYDSKPWTTLFIDGNHENHDRLQTLPQIKMFGDFVGKVSDSVFYLQRGKVYIIDNKRFFTFGGGSSIDKHNRIIGQSWWDKEIPNYQEYARGLKSLEDANWEVDYIITHTCPASIFDILDDRYDLSFKKNEDEKQLKNYLELVKNQTKFKKWYFGHFHDDFNIDEKFYLLYNKIVKLED